MEVLERSGSMSDKTITRLLQPRLTELATFLSDRAKLPPAILPAFSSRFGCDLLCLRQTPAARLLGERENLVPAPLSFIVTDHCHLAEVASLQGPVRGVLCLCKFSGPVRAQTSPLSYVPTDILHHVR